MKRLLNKNAVLVLGLALFMCVVVAAGCNAEQKCPVEVELLRNPAVPALAVAKISAITDTVTITAISANRGNTAVSDHGRFPLPQTIKFGNYIYAGISTSVSSVKEMEIQTNQGSWTFTFK